MHLRMYVCTLNFKGNVYFCMCSIVLVTELGLFIGISNEVN